MIYRSQNRKELGTARFLPRLISFSQLGELRVEVGESAVKLFAVARVLIGLQLFLNASSRQKKYFSLPPNFHLCLR